jgi:hypothetical protein
MTYILDEKPGQKPLQLPGCRLLSRGHRGKHARRAPRHLYLRYLGSAPPKDFPKKMHAILAKYLTASPPRGEIRLRAAYREHEELSE